MKNALERKVTVSSVLKFTLPSIVMMTVLSLYTVIDGAFVSRLIGSEAFSAVNIIYPLSSFTIGIGTMFGTGTAAVISKKLGEGKRDEANRNLTFVTVISTLLGLLFSAVCFTFLDEIVCALGANDVIFEYSRDYAAPIILFFTANILQCQFSNIYVANGKPQIGLFVTVAGGMANVVLDYVFIAVFKMGIAGAAWATGIGYMIPAVFGICYFAFCKRGNFRFVKPRADWRMLGQVSGNGSSEMVSCLSTSVTTFLFNIIMMRLVGEKGVAAISILLYLDFLLTAVILGYSMGVAPLISYNYGRGDGAKLKKLFRVSVLLCTVTGVAMTATTIVFSEHLAAVFSERGSQVYELAAAGLVIYAVSYLFKGYSIFASAMFTAYGNGKISAALSFMRTLVFLTVCLIGMAVMFGVDGVWFATPAAELLAGSLSAVFLVKYRKQYHYDQTLQ